MVKWDSMVSYTFMSRKKLPLTENYRYLVAIIQRFDNILILAEFGCYEDEKVKV